MGHIQKLYQPYIGVLSGKIKLDEIDTVLEVKLIQNK